MRQTEFLRKACDPKTLTVGQLMQDAVFTCGPHTDCLTISRLMTQHHFGSLPVVDEDRKLLGLVTEYDLLQLMIEGRELREGRRESYHERPGPDGDGGQVLGRGG